MGHYKNGQACLNGHAITGDVHSEFREEYCSKCGSETISTCPSCNTGIRGSYDSDFGVIVSSWKPDEHCFKCGAAFPWRQAKLDAVNELAEAIEELTSHERSVIAELMPHLVEETPRTKAAGFKIATIVGKLPAAGKRAMNALFDEVVVEAGKSAIGLG